MNITPRYVAFIYLRDGVKTTGTGVTSATVPEAPDLFEVDRFHGWSAAGKPVFEPHGYAYHRRDLAFLPDLNSVIHPDHGQLSILDEPA